MMKGEKVNIIIADDNNTFIEGLKFIISKNSIYNIIDFYNNGEDLVNSTKLHKANLILTDIEMPVLSGIDAAKIINFVLPELPMIALTMHLDKVFLLDIIKAGFRGFVFKPEVPMKLLRAIELVLDNKFVFPNNIKINHGGQNE